jgi:hypothetical protein
MWIEVTSRAATNSQNLLSSMMRLGLPVNTSPAQSIVGRMFSPTSRRRFWPKYRARSLDHDALAGEHALVEGRSRSLFGKQLVRAAGIEPALCRQNWILSPARLPVPPRPRSREIVALQLPRDSFAALNRTYLPQQRAASLAEPSGRSGQNSSSSVAQFASEGFVDRSGVVG